MKLRRAAGFLIAAPLGAAWLASAPVAGAQGGAGAYRVTRLPAVILPGGGKFDGATVDLEAYDTLLTADLGYSRAARLEAPIEIRLAGLPITAASGEMLPAFRASGGALGPAVQMAYCLPPDARPRGADMAREIQPCFIDRNGDGRLDAAFLVGSRREEDRALVPLDTPFAEQTDVPIPGASIEIVYHVNLQGLAIQLVAGGRPFVVTRVRFGDGGWSASHAELSGPTYPRTVTLGSAQFEILSYDRRARQARARVLAPFQRTEIEFQFPSDHVIINIPVVR